MYNAHRGLGGPPAGSSRLNDLLESVRQEFETQSRASSEYEASSKYPQNFAMPHYSSVIGSCKSCCGIYMMSYGMLISAISQRSIAGDANGPRKGLSDGADYTGNEGKVSLDTLR